jgi:hypothetical protein
MLNNPETRRKEVGYRAVVLDGQKMFHGDGPTPDAAVAVLKHEVELAARLREAREEYPKTIEVDW